MPVWYVLGNNTHFGIKWGKNERQKNYQDQEIHSECVSESAQAERDREDHDLGHCKRSGYRQKDFLSALRLDGGHYPGIRGGEDVNSMLAEHLEFCRMVAGNPSLGFFWNEVQNVTVDILSEIYARHSRLPESDLKIQVSFFVAGAMYVYQRWLRNEIPCSMEELGDKVSQIAFTGVQSILRQS